MRFANDVKAQVLELGLAQMKEGQSARKPQEDKQAKVCKKNGLIDVRVSFQMMLTTGCNNE